MNEKKYLLQCFDVDALPKLKLVNQEALCVHYFWYKNISIVKRFDKQSSTLDCAVDLVVEVINFWTDEPSSNPVNIFKKLKLVYDTGIICA